MAYDFDSASGQSLESSFTDPQTLNDGSFMMSAWGNLDTLDQDCGLLSIMNNGSNVNYWTMFWNDIGRTQFNVRDSGGETGISGTGTGISTGTWFHVVAIVASATDRALWTNGANKGTSTVSRAPSGVNGLSIGALERSSTILEFEGRVAEAAVWSGGFSTTGTPWEVTALAQGYSPLLVRPERLIFYHSLVRNLQPELTIGGTMVNNNGATVGVHAPQIIYPSRPQVLVPPAAAPAVFVRDPIMPGILPVPR